jgi:type I restriction enzyme M protein
MRGSAAYYVAICALMPLRLPLPPASSPLRGCGGFRHPHTGLLVGYRIPSPEFLSLAAPLRLEYVIYASGALPPGLDWSAALNQEESAFLKDLETKLWASANKLLPSLDAARYKHVMLGLIFLKYVSDAFEIRVEELQKEFADPSADYFLGDDADADLVAEELENRDYYTEKNVFWVPESARWKNLEATCRLPVGASLPWGDEFKGVAKLLDDAMESVERENPKLKNILFRDFAREGIEDRIFGQLISDIVGTIPFRHDSLGSKDILGHVYEYFLGEFASAEGKKGGQFYTPKSIVALIVEVLEPYAGRVYDPAMGSGGFFVQSEKFIEAHSDMRGAISVYGQESNSTTWRLAAMNMAIRGIDFNFGGQSANTFTNDLHPDLRADYVMANPPFNQDEWWDAKLQGDRRWEGFPTPPKRNANFAWMLHMLAHLNDNGSLGLLLANGSMSSATNGEDEIRRKLLERDLVECMIALPGQLFTNTQIPACIWFLTKNKKARTLAAGSYRDRRGQFLFITPATWAAWSAESSAYSPRKTLVKSRLRLRPGRLVRATRTKPASACPPR